MERVRKAFCAALAVLMISASFAFASCGADGGTDTTAEKNAAAFEVKTNADGSAVTDTDGKEVTEQVGEGSADGQGADANVSTQSAKDAPQFVLSSAKKEYAAGEDVTVTVTLNNAPLTACFDFYVLTEDGAVYGKISEASVSDMQIAGDGAEGVCRIMGMTATTVDIDRVKIADITFTVPADAKSGDVITFTGNTKDFDVGRDSGGAKTDSVTAKMTDPTLKITVK